MAGDETTIRKFDRELGAHDVRLDGIDKKIDHIEEKMEENHNATLGAIMELKLDKAETKGRDRTIMFAGSGVMAIAMSWASKHLGL